MSTSSSEDDIPLARKNGIKGSPVRMKTNGSSPNLPTKIPRSLDKKLDKEFDRMDIDKVGSSIRTAVSIANGPVEDEGNRRAPKRKVRKPIVKEESASDDEPLTKRRRTNGAAKAAAPLDSSDDDAIPLATKRLNVRKGSQNMVVKKPIKITNKEDSDSDVPLAAAKLSKEKVAIEEQAAKTAEKIRAQDKKAAAAKKRKLERKEGSSKAARAEPKKANGVKKKGESSGDEKPLIKKVKKEKQSAVKEEVKGKKAVKKEETPGQTPEEEDEEEEEYKWWENQPETDGSKKWNTLEHNGVLFPPPYEPLPKNVKMKYNGVEITLSAEAEEVAGFFGAMLDSQHASNPKFQENFFKDFQEIIQKTGGAKDPLGKKVPVKDFFKCDFTSMFDYYNGLREAKKALPAAEKKRLKVEKDELEKKYQFCYLDGRKEKVGNFRVEPPALFRGRGDHPKTGKVKQRVMPEQVTINIGRDAEVPKPPAGHRWKAVQHDDSVTWLATWKENINGNTKYVMLAATSSLKGQSDYKKFEKARELKKYIDIIRKDYEKDLKEPQMAVRQRATAMYLIDRLALRAGNEKGEDEADTVGCCSLRFEHVTLEPPNLLKFDFLGKDSIRFEQTTAVTNQVFKNIKIFKKNKQEGDMIFDRLSTTELNKHLGSYMQGLSAKVFRTYNASWTMQQELRKISLEGTVHDKYASYNAANKKVAELCNHQRTVSSTHATAMAKVDEKIKGVRYQKLRLKRQILYLEPGRKKKDPKYFEPDPEIREDPDWIVDHQKTLIEQEREKITKKFEKENEKLVSEGEKPLPDSELKERLTVLQDMKKEFAEENKTGKLEPKGKAATVEKLEAAVEKLEERIRKAEIEKSVKDENKTVALGTSKINYIDPRLTIMFCKKWDVPIEKLFAKSLREKFKWAIESASPEWEF